MVQAIRSHDVVAVKRQIEEMSSEARSWTDADGRSFLHHAVAAGDPRLIATIEVLCGRASTADTFGLTPHGLAIATGATECADVLRVLKAPVVSPFNQVEPLLSRWPTVVFCIK